MSFATGLAEAGARVAIFDLIDPSPEFFELSTKHGIETAHFKVDVGSRESLEKGFAAVLEAFNGSLDICVACAGTNRNLAFLDTDEEQFDKLTTVNVKGVYFTAQLAAKAMIVNGTANGSIILVASIASYIAIRSQMSSAYCGTKGAVRAMCPPIAAELAKHSIRVNSISPGYVRTEMTGTSLTTPLILLVRD